MGGRRVSFYIPLISTKCHKFHFLNLFNYFNFFIFTKQNEKIIVSILYGQLM